MARAGRLAGRTGGEPAREHMRGRRAWSIWGLEHLPGRAVSRLPGGSRHALRKFPSRAAGPRPGGRRAAPGGSAGRARAPRGRGGRRPCRGRGAAATPPPGRIRRTRSGGPAAAASRLRRPERGGQNEVEHSRGPIEARPSRAGRMMPADGSGRAFGLVRSALWPRLAGGPPACPALLRLRPSASPAGFASAPVPPPSGPGLPAQGGVAPRPSLEALRSRFRTGPGPLPSGPGRPPARDVPRRGTPHAAAILRTPPAAGMRFRAPMPALPPRRRPRRPPQNRAAGGPPQAGSTASRLASLSAISVSSSSVCDSSSSVCSRSAAASFSPSCRAHCRSVP